MQAVHGLQNSNVNTSVMATFTHYLHHHKMWFSRQWLWLGFLWGNIGLIMCCGLQVFIWHNFPLYFNLCHASAFILKFHREKHRRNELFFFLRKRIMCCDLYPWPCVVLAFGLWVNISIYSVLCKFYHCDLAEYLQESLHGPQIIVKYCCGKW